MLHADGMQTWIFQCVELRAARMAGFVMALGLMYTTYGELQHFHSFIMSDQIVT